MQTWQDSSRVQSDIGPDLELVRAIGQRDRKATADFVAAHADVLYAYVFRRVSPLSDVAEDLTQEVFLNALENLPQFKGDSNLRGWLLGIARHKVQDYYRDRLREVALDEPEVEPAIEIPFEDWVNEERLEEKVKSALASLPDAYRYALLWRYWEKCSAAEMGRRTGKTEKAVERMLARARERFRRRWLDE